MSDENTSESETSSVHGLSFTEDEYQALKVERKTFHWFSIEFLLFSVRLCVIYVVQHVLLL